MSVRALCSAFNVLTAVHGFQFNEEAWGRVKMCVGVCGCVRTCVWPGTCAWRKGSVFDEASKKFIYHVGKKMSDQNI